MDPETVDNKNNTHRLETYSHNNGLENHQVFAPVPLHPNKQGMVWVLGYVEDPNGSDEPIQVVKLKQVHISNLTQTVFDTNAFSPVSYIDSAGEFTAPPSDPIDAIETWHPSIITGPNYPLNLN